MAHRLRDRAFSEESLRLIMHLRRSEPHPARPGRRWVHFTTLILAASSPGLWSQDHNQAPSQDATFPEATPTETEGVVTSPYPPNRRIDVMGLEPGSLAQDPISEEIFRVPGASPPPPRPEVQPSPKPEPRRDPEPAPARAQATPNAVSPALEDFLRKFVTQGEINDPRAELPYFAENVSPYFSRERIDHEGILQDRARLIERWPERSYELTEAPVLLERSGNYQDVMIRYSYHVRNGRDSNSGTATDYLTVHQGPHGYRIAGIDEGRARPAETTDLPRPDDGPATDAVHDRMIALLAAFTQSGELEPEAGMVHLHPEIEQYYGSSHPSPAVILKNRRDYDRLWPVREYWLLKGSEEIRQVAEGVYDVSYRVAYRVANRERSARGTAKVLARVVETAEGLKILRVSER